MIGRRSRPKRAKHAPNNPKMGRDALASLAPTEMRSSCLYFLLNLVKIVTMFRVNTRKKFLRISGIFGYFGHLTILTGSKRRHRTTSARLRGWRGSVHSPRIFGGSGLLRILVITAFIRGQTQNTRGVFRLWASSYPRPYAVCGTSNV